MPTYFARLILAARRGDIMQTSDTPKLSGDVRTRAQVSALLHEKMFTKIEPSGSTPKGFSITPHPLFWMGEALVPGNLNALTSDDRKKLTNDATTLMEAGLTARADLDAGFQTLLPNR